jgi:hypothetical protein
VCASNELCTNDQCVCVPNCDDKVCGSDGCPTGTCGSCAANEKCAGGTCVCVPNCSGKVCGTDGCNGSCGSCAAVDETCSSGQCICYDMCDENAVECFGSSVEICTKNNDGCTEWEPVYDCPGECSNGECEFDPF